MLFNSYEFCLLFLPITFALFWGWHSLRWRLSLLTIGSFAFYSFSQFTTRDASFDFRAFLKSLSITSFADLKHSLWAWRFSLVLLTSSSVDYFAARAIVRAPAEARGRKRALLALSLVANLGLLAFFKYAGFFSQIAHDVSAALGGGEIRILSIVLPVGISFYTFESMSYVIDIYRGVATPAKSYLDYACFITFFPHLVAGPIIRYSDILHQFRDVNWTRRGPDWEQVNIGLTLFTMGLVKKLIIADRLAGEINPLWHALAGGGGLGAAQAWGAVLGYTFRIYFDFSGYSDMATGLGHLFGVRLPQNFDSPYKAIDPVDFWKRWHMTLSAWLRDYLYIPLGGDGRKRIRRDTGEPIRDTGVPPVLGATAYENPSRLDNAQHGRDAHVTGKPSRVLQYRNLMFTMLLGGLWHGAAWLFVIWGAWHGLLLAGTHALRRAGVIGDRPGVAGTWVRRQVTFLLVIVGWVLFRAADVKSGIGVSTMTPALKMFKEMAGLGTAKAITFTTARGAEVEQVLNPTLLWSLIAFGWVWCNFLPNSFQIAYRLKERWYFAMATGVTFGVCVLHFGTKMDFLYFRF